MKKIIFISLLALNSFATFSQSKNQTPKPNKSKAFPGMVGYMELSVKPIIGTAGMPLQSFICGRSGDNMLLVGGRTNGFHGTDATDSTINFPAYYSNTNFIVYNPTTGSMSMAPLPAAYKYQLSSTNMLACQDGNFLYGCGGYGKNASGNFVTYNGFFAINVPKMIDSILNGKVNNLSKLIVSTTNNDMAVTGGELLKVGNYFYAVMGQNYTGEYTGPTSTQVYTDEIRQFNVSNTGSILTASLVTRFNDNDRPDNTSRFHRRDLNVVPIINSDLKPGFAVYGGVFTQNVNGIWQNPVYLTQDVSNKPVVTLDSNFLQKYNQYGCAQVLVFDPTSRTMVTNLVGGISYYSDERIADPNAPFVKIISSIYKYPNGTTTEVPSGPNNSLPDFVGAEAHFVPLQRYLYRGTEIIDFSKFAGGGPQLVGYVFGGIKATARQSSTINPTMANKTLYGVYLSRFIPVEEKK